MKPHRPLTVPEVLRNVATLAEQLYPGFQHASIIVRVRQDVPEAVLPVTRLALHLSATPPPRPAGAWTEPA